MLKHILHTGITVTDMDRSIDFYKNTLGLSYQGEFLMEGIETDRLFGRENCKARPSFLKTLMGLFSNC